VDITTAYLCLNGNGKKLSTINCHRIIYHNNYYNNIAKKRFRKTKVVVLVPVTMSNIHAYIFRLLILKLVNSMS